MKAYMRWMATAGLLLPVVELAAQAPEPKAEVKPEPKAEVEAAPDVSKPQGRAERPMEKAAFLGVAVVPAPPSLQNQLGVPEGTGLLVIHVEPESAAVGKLQEHDLLTRFNDQILVNPEQLTTLVHNAGVGSEVTLKLIRKKAEETVAVTLGEREWTRGRFGSGPFGWWGPGEPWQRKHDEVIREMKERAGELRERAEERLKDARERREQRRGDPAPEPPERGAHPTVKHSTWVEDGLILNLVESGGSKRLTVEKNGQKVFEGPVDNEEQRQKVPQEYREKLDKMDSATAPKAKESKGEVL